MKQNKSKTSNLFQKLRPTKLQATIILTGVYLFLSFAANIAATKVTFFGKLVMDAGFIYALTFTWRDLIHKQLGKEAAVTTIMLAGVVNILAALYFQFVVIMPAEPSWALAGGQKAWEFLFGIQLRIVIASAITQVIAELVDTWSYQSWTKGIGKGKPQWLRVAVSNFFSIPVDSILFPLIAFAGIVPMGIIFQMFLTNIMVKWIITGLSAWMIYLVPEKPIYRE